MIEKDGSLIFDIIEEKIGFSKKEIFDGGRARHIVDMKRIIAIILKKNTKLKLWKIGEIVGGLDHSCISHYIKTQKNLIDTDRNYRENFRLVEREYLARRDTVETKLEIKLRERKELNKEIQKLKALMKIKESYKK